MEFKDLKKGSYVRWTANRMFKAWDTYGVVLKKTKTSVTIMTYDDFKKTDLSDSGEAIDDEMRLATKEEVENYIDKRKVNLKKELLDIQLNFEKRIKDINKDISVLEEIKL